MRRCLVTHAITVSTIRTASIATIKYDQRYGDSSSTSINPDHDTLNVDYSNAFENGLMLDNAGHPESSGSQVTQTWQVVENGKSGLRQYQASQLQWGTSSANRPPLSQGIALGATFDGASALTKSISPDGWTTSMPMDLSSNSSVMSNSAYHSPPGLQLHNGVDLQPGNAYTTTTHRSPIVPQQASLFYEVDQTQWSSSVQTAAETAAGIAQANLEDSHILSEFSHHGLDFSGNMQQSHSNNRMGRHDPRPSTGQRRNQYYSPP
ncbi:MAG: hypothetical protein Q9195_006800 [Heterodermia aff. obscurata]